MNSGYSSSSYGDMRIAMNTLMIAKWRALGSYQSRYVPTMIGPFLKVSLIPHTGKGPTPPPGWALIGVVTLMQ